MPCEEHAPDSCRLFSLNPEMKTQKTWTQLEAWSSAWPNQTQSRLTKSQMTCDHKNKCLRLFVIQQKLTNAKHVTPPSCLMLCRLIKTSLPPSTWTSHHSLDLCFKITPVGGGWAKEARLWAERWGGGWDNDLSASGGGTSWGRPG